MTSLAEVEWYELMVEWREKRNDVDSGALEIFLVIRGNMFIIKLICLFSVF